MLENIQDSMSSMKEMMKALLQGQNESNCGYDWGVNNSGVESPSTS